MLNDMISFKTLHRPSQRNINKGLIDYLAVTLPAVDLSYIIAITWFSQHRLLSFLLCIFYPAFNVFFTKLATRFNKPLYQFGFIINGFLFILNSWVAGPKAAGWLFSLSNVVGDVFIVFEFRSKVLFITYHIFMATLGNYIAGKSLDEIVEITVVLFAVAAVLLRSFAVLIDQNERIEEERKKSDYLLLNILPESIADRMKLGETKIADRFEMVSVLFADITDFTKLSSGTSPEQLVGLLDQVFSEYDQVAKGLGLEKIKTIGDAYMVVAGVPKAHPNPSEAIAQMALAIHEITHRLSQSLGILLQVRVGIHTGAVVAGVIGNQKFAYDLWGDTVNIASRMESQGIPGQTHCTEEIYYTLKDHYEFEPRGMIEVKGKGMMRTFLLKQPLLCNA
jgi:class 3 adenylate cyclase